MAKVDIDGVAVEDRPSLGDRFQLHLLPAGPLLSGQPAAIGVSHDTGITHQADARQSQ